MQMMHISHHISARHTRLDLVLLLLLVVVGQLTQKGGRGVSPVTIQAKPT